MITFYSDNLIKQSIITASSQNALFPVSNLKDQRRTKVWRSISNSSSVVFDLIETSQFDSIIVVDDPKRGFGVSTITVEAANSDEWSAPPYSAALTFSTAHGVGLLEIPSIQEYRFVRFVLTSSLGYCELSTVFIGLKTDVGRGINLGWSYRDDDLSSIVENQYGQQFSDIKGRKKIFNAAIQNIDMNGLDKFFEIYDTKGKVNPFFIKIGCEDSVTDILRYVCMVYFDNISPVTQRFFNNFGVTLQMSEAK